MKKNSYINCIVIKLNIYLVLYRNEIMRKLKKIELK